MKTQPASMTGRLITGLFFCTAAVFLFSGYILHQKIERIVVSSIEQQLLSRLKVITGLLHEENGRIELDQSDVISGEYSIPRSGHYYLVSLDKRTLAVSASLSGYDHYFKDLPDVQTTADNPQQYQLLSSIGPVGEPARVLIYSFLTEGRQVKIIVAQSLSDSLRVIESFRHILLITIACGTVLLCITSLVIAKRSLLPLKELCASMESISHDRLNSRLDNENSVQELKQLSTSFNSLLDRLGNAFESQKRLVADASHELKTPIAVIKTQCDVILQRVRTTEEYVQALQTVREYSCNISSTINNLLSLARLDSGGMSRDSFQAVSLTDCINHAVNLTRPLADQKQVAVSARMEQDIIVNGAETQLREAFVNLVENGIRYNQAGGNVTIAATSRDNLAVVTVTDNGIGMEQPAMEKIYERFYRGDSHRSTEGTGLGLSIVKAVTEAHGGTISCESKPGAGTRFTLTLPREILTTVTPNPVNA